MLLNYGPCKALIQRFEIYLICLSCTQYSVTLNTLSVLSDQLWLRSLVWSIDRGDIQGPGSTAPSSAFKRLVAWWRNSCTVLPGSHTFVNGVGDNVIPRRSFLRVLALDAEPLGPNTSLFSNFTLFPCYREVLSV